MSSQRERAMKPTDLRGILRYVPMFRDHVFVIAVDGSIVSHENFANIVTDIAVLLDTQGKRLPKFAHQEIASFLQQPERETRPSTLATAQSYLKTLNSERVARAHGVDRPHGMGGKLERAFRAYPERGRRTARDRADGGRNRCIP